MGFLKHQVVKSVISSHQHSLLLVILALMLPACSPVHFENINSEQLLKVDVCDDFTEGVTWWEETGDQSYECQTCADGSRLTCVRKIETEVECSDGRIRPTGRQRDGREIGSTQVCPQPPPSACGTRPHESVWWQEEGSREIACETCAADGSVRRCLVAVENELRCANGTEIPSGASRDGRVISFMNECPVLPPPPPPPPTPTPPPTPVATPPPVAPQSESFAVPVGGTKVDILLVLDTTGSMDRDLEKLSLRFSNLIARLNGLDWQIAITNTGVGTGFMDGFALNGQLMSPLEGPAQRSLIGYEVIKKTTPNAEQIFRLSVGREAFEGNCDFPPYCLGSKNQPLKATIKTMERQLARGNSPFFRPGAAYVPLILSDEDELENGPATATQPQAVIDSFKTMLAGRSPKMVAHALIVKPGDSACLSKQSSFFNPGGKYGNLINDFVTHTGGVVGSVCDDDYGFILSSISENIRQSVDSVELKDTPDPASVRVSFAPHADIAWTVSGKKIQFASSVPGGTTISVEYRPQGN